MKFIGSEVIEATTLDVAAGLYERDTANPMAPYDEDRIHLQITAPGVDALFAGTSGDASSGYPAQELVLTGPAARSAVWMYVFGPGDDVNAAVLTITIDS